MTDQIGQQIEQPVEHDFFSASAALARLEQLDVPAMELVYRLECGGEDFYNTLADRIDNEQAAELLRRNAREELGHARRISRAIGIKLGHDYEPSGQVLDPFVIPVPDVVDPSLLPIIVQAEIDGDAGYQRWADHEPDPEVARLLRLNGREETGHGERVAQVLELLRVGSA
jgi:rubrerythrin